MKRKQRELRADRKKKIVDDDDDDDDDDDGYTSPNNILVTNNANDNNEMQTTLLVYNISEFLKTKQIVNASFLIDHLRRDGPMEDGRTVEIDDDNARHSSITKKDIASILLPWCVSRLMRSERTTTPAATCATSANSRGEANNDENEEEGVQLLAWEGLSTCLDVLLPRRSNDTDTSFVVHTVDETAASGNGSIFTTTTNDNNNNNKGGDDDTPNNIGERRLLLPPPTATNLLLSQSVLLRLLTLAVKVSFSTNNNDTSSRSSSKSDENLHMATSNAYIHLIQLYHPTLHVACKTLLPLIDNVLVNSIITYNSNSNSNNNTTTEKQDMRSQQQTRIIIPNYCANILSSTLTLILQSMVSMSEYSNNKRTFTLLSSMDVLSILGRWALMSSSSVVCHGKNDDDDDDDMTPTMTKVLVEQIIQEGLFFSNGGNDQLRPSAAMMSSSSGGDVMDGFRECCGIGATFITTKENVNDDDDEDEIKGTKKTKTDVMKQKITKTKTTTITRYQSSLFDSIRDMIFLPLETTATTTMMRNGEDNIMDEDDGQATMTLLPSSFVLMTTKATSILLPMIVRGFFKRAKVSSSSYGSSPTTTATSSMILSPSNGIQFRFWYRIILPTIEKLELLVSKKEQPSDSGSISPSPLSYLSETTSLVCAVSDTLSLVLNYDIYSPSYTDPNGLHLSFLERVTKILLLIIGDDIIHMNIDHKHYYYTLLSSLFASYYHLLLLNHRLLHDKLVDIISFAWSCLIVSSVSSLDSNNSKLMNTLSTTMKVNADGLLAAIVKTYRELRQLGYFLTCIRNAYHQVIIHDEQQGNYNNSIVIRKLLEQHLSTSYQTDLPSGQLPGVWEFFDEWIMETTVKFLLNSNNDTKEVVVVSELSLAVEMFIVFIKNIRTNKQNCILLRSLCERSMSTSVSKLVRNVDELGVSLVDRLDNVYNTQQQQQQQRMGLDLCGWLVDLHTRSCFWIDNSDNDADDNSIRENGITFLFSGTHDDNNSILAYLRNVVDTTLSTERYKLWKSEQWLDDYWRSTAMTSETTSICDIEDDVFPPPMLCGALQRLALHRVHQLHSMIYYCNLNDSFVDHDDDDELLPRMKEDDCQYSSLPLVNEAKMLVDFSLFIASCPHLMMRQTNPTTDQGTAIMKVIDQSSTFETLWAPVAQSLFIWTNYSDPFHAEVFLIWFFTALCQGNTRPGLLQVEMSIALTIARDSSFYDVNEIMTLFMKVGIQFAIRKFLDNIEMIPLAGASRQSRSSKRVKPEHITCDIALTTSSISELIRKSGKINLIPVNNIDVVSRILSFLASAPVEYTLCRENLALLDSIFGFDILASHIVINFSKDDVQRLERRVLLDIVRSSKIIMSNILPRTLLSSSDLDAPCVKSLASHMIRNCHILRDNENMVCAASCNAISEYLSMCIDYYEKNPSMLVELLTQMNALIHDSTIDFSTKVCILRSVIRQINIFCRQHSPSKKNAADNITAPHGLFLRFALDSLKHLHSSVIEHLSYADIDKLISDKVSTMALLFEAEALSLAGILSGFGYVPEINESTTTLRAQEVFSFITAGKRAHRSLEFISASNYFMSVIAATPDYFLQIISLSELLKYILEALAQSYVIGQDTPLLDASLCSLIRASSGLETMEYVISYVLNESSESGAAGNDPTFITKIFHILITCTNGHDQQNYIANKCKTFLLISINLLRQNGQCAATTSKLASNVKLFSKTMTTLISKKELFLMSGREIALICSEMNPLFVALDDAKDETLIFSCCCSVVASLIAHYPKQLYGCPNCLFSFLMTLLTHILRMSVRKGLSRQALEYAK